MAEEPAKPPPERTWWPSIWYKDQLFWREVTTRALAGLIVVVLTGLAALASGLFNDDRYRTSAWIVVGIAVWGLVWAPLSAKVIGWSRTKGLALRLIVPAVSLAVFIAGFLVISSFNDY